MSEQDQSQKDSSPAPCSLIATNGDRELCEDCYDEGYLELDETTHYFATLLYGVCDCCGLETKKANAEAEPRSLGEKCGHQCRTLDGLHTCTLAKGHEFWHQEYGPLSVLIASWGDDQGRCRAAHNTAISAPSADHGAVGKESEGQ